MSVRVVKIAVIVLLSLSAGLSPADDKRAEKAELAALEGVWIWVSSERKGKEATAEELHPQKLVIKGTELKHLRDGKVVQSGTIRLKPGRSPKEFTVHLDEGKGTSTLLYSVVGDVLILAGDEPGKDCPRGFTRPKADDPHYLDVLKRKR